MCRHCERLVEDVEHKETVHKFMDAAARSINKRFGLAHNLETVTADDLDVDIKISARFRGVHSLLRDMYK